MTPRWFEKWTGPGARFGLQSGLSFAMNLGLTVALHESAGLRPEFAFALVLALTTVTNFLLLRYFVFPGRRGPLLRQFGLFVASSLGFRCLEYGLFLLFHTRLGLAYRPVIVGTLSVSFVTKYFYYGSVVFRRREAGGVAVPAAAGAPGLGRAGGGG